MHRTRTASRIWGPQESVAAPVHDARLHGAQIHGAQLHGAQFHGAQFHGARLHEPRLRDARRWPVPLAWAVIVGVSAVLWIAIGSTVEVIAHL